MKIKIVLIIIISLFSCTTQPTNVKKWFPDTPDGVANFGAIYEYMQNFKTDDINVARNTYLNVLVFIKEVIDASHENLKRAHRMISPTVKRPAIINGKLTIIESTEMTDPLSPWDDVRMEYVEAVLIDVLWEFMLIFGHSIQYNALLDHWYSLTGEFLGEHIDIVAVHDNLIQDIVPLLEPRSFRRSKTVSN
jgi:hypothetical protein